MHTSDMLIMELPKDSHVSYISSAHVVNATAFWQTPTTCTSLDCSQTVTLTIKFSVDLQTRSNSRGRILPGSNADMYQASAIHRMAALWSIATASGHQPTYRNNMHGWFVFDMYRAQRRSQRPLNLLRQPQRYSCCCQPALPVSRIQYMQR